MCEYPVSTHLNKWRLEVENTYLHGEQIKEAKCIDIDVHVEAQQYKSACLTFTT